MAIKTFTQITSDILDAILTVNPKIDVKIGSVVRDIFIDAHINEFIALYGIADYGARASSVLYAQNEQLDRLGQNFNVFRNPATRSTVLVTIVVNGSVTAPTPINIGDQFYTLPNVNNVSYTFMCVQSALLMPGQTQITILCAALTPGAASNVPAYTIVRHNYDFADSVFNAEPATGGTDRESDAAFAARIPLAITGKYVNTYTGITNMLQSVGNILNAPVFVTPDNVLSRGPYAVDIYLQRDSSYQGTPITETVPANLTSYQFMIQPLYELNPIIQVSYLNPQTQQQVVIPEFDSNGNPQYQIIANPSDFTQNYPGSIYAGQRLQWVNSSVVPNVPYSVTYNYDNTIVNAQQQYDSYSEITADLLFKQAKAIPVWVGANIALAAGSNTATAYTNCNSALISLFDSTAILQSLSEDDVTFNFLGVPTVNYATVTNFDTTYEIVLTSTITNNVVSFTLPASGANSAITPFGFYWENDVPALTGLPLSIAGRLWVGNPDYIDSDGYSFAVPTNKTGVPDKTTVNSVLPSWQCNVDTYFDQKTGTIIFNFDTPPPTTGNPVITLHVVQSNIATSGNMNYLTLAPSIYLTPVLLPNSPLNNPIYAVACPADLDPQRARLYKNGVPLTASVSGVTADYQIAGPDPTTNLYRISFTTPPLATDVLQYGLLNPDLTFTVL